MQQRIGVIRDERYLEHMPGHVHYEHPSRLRAVYRMLDKEFRDTFRTYQPEPCTIGQLERIHSPIYIQKVLKTSEIYFTHLTPDTPVCGQSNFCSWLAVGGCLIGLKALMEREVDVCFCFVRPPGHHAMPDRAGGFCIFNNIAVAAKEAIVCYGIKRILIIDWDIHHGNGIQDIFYDDPAVYYFSTHYQASWPYSGQIAEIGKDQGLGYTMNVPLPKAVNDEEFIYLYSRLLPHVFESYKPELVIVAAGFDGHEEDLSNLAKLTEASFRNITSILMNQVYKFHRPPVLFAMEGGYYPPSLASSIKEVLSELIVPSDIDEMPRTPSSRIEGRLQAVMSIHNSYSHLSGVSAV